MKSIFIFIVMSLLMTSCQAEVINYSPLFKCTDTLDDPYGVVAHISRSGPEHEFDTRDLGLDLIRSVGISFIRTDFDWTNFRTKYQRDSVCYKRFDKMMQSVSSRHLNMLGIISNSDRNKFPIWSNHLNLLMRQYISSVNYWEIVNEADLYLKRSPDYSPDDYMRLLKEGYKIIKKNNCNAKVLYTGISDFGSELMLETFKMGASSYFDIMNVHLYTAEKKPETLIGHYNYLNKILIKFKINKPVWLTETGYSTKGKECVTEEEQAIRLPRCFLISFAMGVDKVFWYNSKASELSDNDRECHFGIMHNDYTPKPAYYTYKTLIQMCPNKSSRPVLSIDNGVYKAKWKRRDGKTVLAIWTSQGEIPVKIESERKYSCFNVFGEKVALGDENLILITNKILYIVGSKNINIQTIN